MKKYALKKPNPTRNTTPSSPAMSNGTENPARKDVRESDKSIALASNAKMNGSLNPTDSRMHIAAHAVDCRENACDCGFIARMKQNRHAKNTPNISEYSPDDRLAIVMLSKVPTTNRKHAPMAISLSPHRFLLSRRIPANARMQGIPIMEMVSRICAILMSPLKY